MIIHRTTSEPARHPWAIEDTLTRILAGGTIIAGASVQHSILFPRAHVGDEAVVRESILFEGVEVGDNARLNNCIVDKDVRIPAGESIGIDPGKDAQRFTISPKGIVVVHKGYRFGDSD